MEKKQDSPKVGTPAPPIDPYDVPGLVTDEKPKIKRKNRSVSLRLMILVSIFVLAIISVMLLNSSIINSRTKNETAIAGDGRIEPPNKLPTSTLMQGVVSGAWQSVELAPLAWHGWVYEAHVGDRLEIYVHPRSADFIPILGLYSADDNLVLRAQQDRIDPLKSLSYTFEDSRQYTILVGNIGGAVGAYEIRVQLKR